MSALGRLGRRKWVRRIVRGLAALVVLLIVGVVAARYYFRYEGKHRLAQQVAALDANDPRWRWEDIEADRRVIPDNKNSAAVLIPKFAVASRNRNLDPLGPDGKSLLFAGEPNRLLGPAEAESVASTLSEIEDVVAIARSFADYPRGRHDFPPDADWFSSDDMFNHLSSFRSVAYVLRLDAEYLSLEDRPDEAISRIGPMFNVSHALADEPALMSQLVRSAICAMAVHRLERALALGTPRSDLAGIQAELMRESRSDFYFVGVRGERAAMHRVCTRLESGQIALSRYTPTTGLTTPEPIEARTISWVVGATFLPANHAVLLEMTTKAYEARALPEHERHQFLTALLRQHKTDVANGLRYRCESFLTHLEMPVMVKCHEADLRTRAQLRCAAVGLAVERFRRAHGRWPESLNEVPKDILPAIPLDPIDGQRLRYVKREDGVTVYSIGIDGKDDGGQNGPSAGSRDRRDDIGFRLYSPDHRRLPALPAPKGDEMEFEPELGPEPRVVKDRDP